MVSDHLVANYDTMALLADVLAVDLDPADTDGLSFMPALQGDADAPQHDYVVYASQDGPSLVTREGWKLRVFLRRDGILEFAQFGAHPAVIDDAVIYQLYYLPDDYREANDLADEEPDKLHELRALLLKACDGNLANGTPQAHFAFYNYGYASGPGALTE
jgi:arylsulfatase A-like enzyme